MSKHICDVTENNHASMQSRSTYLLQPFEVPLGVRVPPTQGFLSYLNTPHLAHIGILIYPPCALGVVGGGGSPVA